jgi:hypothetical protein
MTRPLPGRICSCLAAERGDIPARVGGEAGRVHHDLAQVVRLPALQNAPASLRYGRRGLAPCNDGPANDLQGGGITPGS